jgi:hypothetical protein
MSVSGHLHAAASLPPGSHWIGGWVGPRVCWKMNHGHLACSLVCILLSYPVYNLRITIVCICTDLWASVCPPVDCDWHTRLYMRLKRCWSHFSLFSFLRISGTMLPSCLCVCRPVSVSPILLKQVMDIHRIWYGHIVIWDCPTFVHTSRFPYSRNTIRTTLRYPQVEGTLEICSTVS